MHPGMIATLRAFLRLEASSGVVLLAAAVLAVALANSAAAPAYHAFLHFAVPTPGPGPDLSIEWWINDALMVVFILLVCLEIKREMVEGELAAQGTTTSRAALPIIAAAAGMAVPAAIYAAITWDDPAVLRGWAIPAATDIAFAVGVLAMVGSRVPPSLKVFLLALAIVDDLGAILIIALFYAGELSPPALAAAAACLTALVVLNRFGVTRLWPYLVVGGALWMSVVHSGIHATIAGVLLAMTIPARTLSLPEGEGRVGIPDPSSVPDSPNTPAVRLKHSLHPWVAFGILPLFALANAGVDLSGFTLAALFAPVPLAIAAGLFAGKQLGVFAAVWASVRVGLVALPAGATWAQVWGVAVLCGIGFTMSLFIGVLAFPGDAAHLNDVRLGVLSGSLLSAVAGYAILRLAPRHNP